MSYVLEDLMRIRKHREQSALNRILRARKRLDEAKGAAQQRANELSDFVQWRKNEENRLFNEIQRKLNKIFQLNYYNECVNSLKLKQDKLTEKLEQAKQNVIQADEEVNKAFENYQLRHREKRKLEEHKNKWLTNKMFMDQRYEENEMDEISTMRFNSMRLL